MLLSWAWSALASCGCLSRWGPVTVCCLLPFGRCHQDPSATLLAQGSRQGPFQRPRELGFRAQRGPAHRGQGPWPRVPLRPGAKRDTVCQARPGKAYLDVEAVFQGAIGQEAIDKAVEATLSTVASKVHDVGVTKPT